MEKARRFLGAAQCCYENGFCDSCVSRCYYAVYRAAIAALEKEGFRRPSWNHGSLMVKFRRQLIDKRGSYASEFQDILRDTYRRRVIADYKEAYVPKNLAQDSVNRSACFVEEISKRLKGGQ